jgi:hypothetical protein
MRDGTGSEPCGSSVVILDLHRLRISSFQLKQCGSILSIAWAGDNAIAAVCHINPSLSEYIETDVSTGVTTRDLLGYDFTRSPSGTKVAHVGLIVDFATPDAQSNYLQIDHTTVYPLPSGSGPVEQKTLEHRHRSCIAAGQPTRVFMSSCTGLPGHRTPGGSPSLTALMTGPLITRHRCMVAMGESPTGTARS